MPRYQFTYFPANLDHCPAFPNGQMVPRAVVGASLRKGDKSSPPFFGIVDTGADYCIFPSELLAPLGIDWETLPTAVGSADDKDVRFAVVGVEVEQLGVRAVYAGFSDNLNGKPYGTLGHLGFLNHYSLRFDPHNLKFEFEDLDRNSHQTHQEKRD